MFACIHLYLLHRLMSNSMIKNIFKIKEKRKQNIKFNWKTESNKIKKQSKRKCQRQNTIWYNEKSKPHNWIQNLCKKVLQVKSKVNSEWEMCCLRWWMGCCECESVSVRVCVFENNFCSAFWKLFCSVRLSVKTKTQERKIVCQVIIVEWVKCAHHQNVWNW